MDPAEQLARIYQAGFDVQQFDRYPRALGIVRDGVIALFEPTPDGLRMIGVPGWRMGEVMGVLVEQDGRQVFQAKSEVIEATAEKLEAIRRFRGDLENLLTPKA